MRIGIVPVLDRNAGGIFQYSQTMLRAMESWRTQQPEDDLILFADHPDSSEAEILRRSGWLIAPLIPSSHSNVITAWIHQLTDTNLRQKIWRMRQQISHGAGIDRIQARPDVKRWLQSFGVDLLLYPYPDVLTFEVGIPYIMAIHDLQHKLQPHFPEVSQAGNLYWREYLFRNSARSALILFADSEVGKEDILNFYSPFGVAPNQIHVLPFLPAYTKSAYVAMSDRKRVREQYQLPDRFLFYPAQFWPHKNHIKIIQALAHIQFVHRVKIPIVLVGLHTGRVREHNYRQFQNQVRDLNIEDLVHYLGYAPDEDMPSLYAEAEALIMPTFFGPTNIPVLEAWAFRCPVITSDIHGIRQQCGGAALLVDPTSIESIAAGMYRVWTEPDLRQELIQKGLERVSAYTFADFQERLFVALEGARLRLLRNQTLQREKTKINQGRI